MFNSSLPAMSNTQSTVFHTIDFKAIYNMYLLFPMYGFLINHTVRRKARKKDTKQTDEFKYKQTMNVV